MEQTLYDTYHCLASVDLVYVVLGLCCGIMFIVGESVNIWILLRFFGEKAGLLRGLKYGFTGFFFSSITPSATGGQPMQLYAMGKDKVEFSHGSLALLLEFISSQSAMTIMGTIAFFINREMIAQSYPALLYFIIIAIAGNILLMVLIITIIANEKAAYGLLSMYRKILNRVPRLSAAKKEKWSESAEKQVKEFRRCSTVLSNNKRILLKTIPVSMIQMSFLFAIPYIAYCALGLTGISFLTIFCMQAVLHLASSLVPLPGAAGANEGGFVLLYQNIFTAGMTVPAVLFSRGISFYSMLLLSGIIMGALSIYERRLL